MAALRALIEVVESGGLDQLDTAGLLGFAQDFEQLRNELPLADHRLVRDLTIRDVAGELCQGRLTRVLTQALRISAAEAARRVRAAEQVGGRVDPLGDPLPARWPVLAAAQRDGAVSPEQVERIVAGLARVDRPGFDSVQVAAGERQLTSRAQVLGPKDLQACVDRFVDSLDRDGSRSQDAVNEEGRHVDLRVQRDGSWRGELRLTGPVGVKLQAVLSPLARPRVPSGSEGREVKPQDERTQGQRMHDALEDVCDRLLRAGGLPDSGGVPTTVIVTIDHESLLARTGHGTTSAGTRLSAAQVLELAEQAEVIPAVLNRSGAVLSLGRSRRLASRAQTLALYARDSGCSFPGCDVRPAWCERHHLRAWIDGGATDLDNLTLVCRYHHHNFAARGWACQLTIDGLPEWVPPRHVDRDQKPLVNARIGTARRRHALAA